MDCSLYLEPRSNSTHYGVEEEGRGSFTPSYASLAWGYPTQTPSGVSPSLDGIGLESNTVNLRIILACSAGISI
jgi:hypothetical protein